MTNQLQNPNAQMSKRVWGLVPENNNDRRPQVVLGYEWVLYFVLLTPLWAMIFVGLITVMRQ